MVRRRGWLVWIVLAAVRVGAEPTQRSEPDPSMSEDVHRMHERLVALSEGDGSVSELRIEFFDGNMASHRSFNVEAGTLVSKEWESPGAPMIRREGTVTDPRVAELVEQLIAKQYWTFEGTRFVPDASMFLFRFYYGDSSHVDFRCDAEEFRNTEREEIRNLFLSFVADTEMRSVPPD